MFRVNHYTWWSDEMPNEKEKERGIENLKKCNNDVDFIVSHCCPQEIATLFSMGVLQIR